jgi:hypothetical protein
MNKINTRELISEMRQMLGPNKMTCEGLVYGEDGDEMMYDKPAIGDEEMGGDQAMQQLSDMAGANPGEENPLDGDPEITKLITNIRVLTLKGLTKLANNPETAQYDLLKKIFLQIDKSVEDKMNPEK